MKLQHILKEGNYGEVIHFRTFPWKTWNSSPHIFQNLTQHLNAAFDYYALNCISL